MVSDNQTEYFIGLIVNEGLQFEETASQIEIVSNLITYDKAFKRFAIGALIFMKKMGIDTEFWLKAVSKLKHELDVTDDYDKIKNLQYNFIEQMTSLLVSTAGKPKQEIVKDATSVPNIINKIQ